MSVNKQRKGKMSLDSQNTTSVVPDINPIQEPNALPIQTALPTQTVAPVTDQTLVPIPNGLDKEKAPVIDPNEPAKDEKKSADDIDDLNDYDDLNKRWKKNQLGDIYAAQQTALTMRGKDEYDKQQKLNPKPPEQLTSMLPRQSLSVHRFLQYCNADKEGNVKKSIFLWHNVGSGKTFTSLIIALNSLDLFNENPTKNVYQPTNKPSYKKKIIIVAPGGIFVNFENELKEKLNVKLYGGLTDDEKKKSPLENTEGFNSCTWTVNGKKSKPFHLIGYRYSAIVKYIKNNTDTYVNPLKNLFADSVVIFDECHRLFRPIEPLIPTAEYFIDNGLLQNSLRCILMTGTPFNTTTTDMITMLTFMKCAVLIPPVDKKCSRIYPIEFISKTPRPTEMKEIVSTASFGILCSILNFFPGVSVLLATYNWPNKIKAYMAILHEDWQKRGLSTEQGILELLGREMNVKTMASGLFDGANNDNQAAEGFAFVNIEDFYKGLGFTEEIDNTVKETINGIFQGSSSFIKIELSEIKKYQGNYGAICELVDIINNEEIPKLNLSTDEHIIVIGKLYRYIKSLCLFVGVETFLFDFIESYILNIIKKASDATEDFVVENVTKTIAYIFTHNILLKGTSITTEQLNKIMTTVDTFCFELLQDLYSKVSTEIKNYCISIKDKEPINNVELNSDLNTRITNIIEEFLNETLNKFITLEDNISKELGVTDLVSKISKGNMASQISSGVKIFNYGKSGFNFLKDGLNSSRLIIQKLKLLYGKKTVNDSVTRDIEEGDFVKAGSFIIIGAGALAGVATAAKVVAVVAGAIGTVGIATPYLLAIGLGGLVVGSGIIDANGIISYLNGKEIDDVKNNDVVKVQIKNVENCIEIKDKLSEIENINNSEIENLESKIEEESENPQQHVEINYAEELERLKRERNCQSLLRLNSICTDLETIKNNFEIIFNKSWTNKIGKIFTDINLLKQKSVQMLQSIIADKEKNNEAIRHFDLGVITGKASKNLTALVTDLLKEINQPNYVKNHNENMGFLNTAISRINNFLSNIDIELKSCFISDNFGVLFGGNTKNLPADIPELIKDSYEKLEFDEYTNDINLINKQYKLLAVKYHPDRCKLIEGESEIDKINRCNNSFAELSNAYKNVTEYFEVQNNKYYSIVHKLVFVRYANDNFTKL